MRRTTGELGRDAIEAGQQRSLACHPATTDTHSSVAHLTCARRRFMAIMRPVTARWKRNRWLVSPGFAVASANSASAGKARRHEPNAFLSAAQDRRCRRHVAVILRRAQVRVERQRNGVCCRRVTCRTALLPASIASRPSSPVVSPSRCALVDVFAGCGRWVVCVAGAASGSVRV
jgi:hypothetical protein